jgi:hypothetical protein
MKISELIFNQHLYLETDWMSVDWTKYFKVRKFELAPWEYTVRINNNWLKLNTHIDMNTKELNDFLNISNTDG